MAWLVGPLRAPLRPPRISWEPPRILKRMTMGVMESCQVSPQEAAGSVGSPDGTHWAPSRVLTCTMGLHQECRLDPLGPGGALDPSPRDPPRIPQGPPKSSPKTSARSPDGRPWHKGSGGIHRSTGWNLKGSPGGTPEIPRSPERMTMGVMEICCGPSTSLGKAKGTSRSVSQNGFQKEAIP